jgi:type 1 glutamine amidotransferase
MKKALIVWGGWDGHKPKELTEIFTAILKEKDFAVETSDTVDSFSDLEKLKSFDLIIPNWTMGGLKGEQEEALAKAIESGVGLAGCHGGMGDAFRSNTTYQFMVGGQFVSHPDNGKDYTVKIKGSDPIVKGVADFSVHSEQYFLHVDPSIEVLATTEFQTQSAPWVNGTIMPVVWKKAWGKGRVFYNALGHEPELFQKPEIREIQTRGFLWAAR